MNKRQMIANERKKREAEFARKVDSAMTDVKKLVKRYGIKVVSTATYRLHRAISQKEKAQAMIQQKEKELAQLKGKYQV